MSYFVYILYSQKDKKLYVGCTTDVVNRLNRHNNGQVFSTKHRRPLSLIYTEQYQDKTTAFNRERFLKSLWGARLKKKALEKFLKRNTGVYEVR